MRKTILIFLFLFPILLFSQTYNVTLDGTQYTLRDHPRIFNPSNLDTTNNIYYNTLRDHLLSERASNPDYSSTTITSTLSHYMAGYALLYRLNPTVYNDFGDAAMEIMLGHVENYTIHNDFARHHTRKIAMAYDWAYPKVTESIRDSLFTWFNDVCWPAMWGNRLIYGDFPEHNLYHTMLSAGMLFGIATWEDNQDGEYGTSGNDSEYYLDWAYSAWSDSVQPLIAEYYSGGHSWSGSAYGNNRTWRYALYMLEVLKSGFTDASMDTWDDNLWWDDIINYFIYASYGNSYNNSSAQMYSDGNVGGDDWTARLLEPLNIAISHNKTTADARRGQYFLNTYVQASSDGNDDGTYIVSDYYFKWFLWADTSINDSNYTTEAITGYLADGVDLYFSKSDWSTTGTHFSFSASDWIGDHQGENMGSYKIWKNEYLLYENGPDGNGMEEENNILFLDDGIVRRWWGQSVTTGGFQYTGDEANGTYTPMEANINYHEETAYYNYASSRLDCVYVDNTGSSYPMKKLDYFRRSFIHFKPSNSSKDYIVMCDNINSVRGAGTTNNVDNGEEVQKTIRNFHPAQPSISGNQISVTGIGSSAKLITSVVYPNNYDITSTDVTDLTSGISGDNVYRVDITADDIQEYEQFVIVYYPDTNTSSTMASTDSIVISGMRGVHIADANRNFIALFSSDSLGASPSGSIQYSYDQSATSTHVIADLTGSYSINSSGTTTKTITLNPAGSDYNVSDDGILSFSVTSDNTIALLSDGESGGGEEPPAQSTGSGSMNPGGQGTIYSGGQGKMQ